MASQEVGHSKEAPELVNIRWRRHVDDRFDLLLFWVDPVFVDTKSEEGDFFFAELTLVLLQLDIRFSERIKRTGQIIVMILVVVAVDKNIVEPNDGVVFVLNKNFFQGPLEDFWG